VLSSEGGSTWTARTAPDSTCRSRRGGGGDRGQLLPAFLQRALGAPRRRRAGDPPQQVGRAQQQRQRDRGVRRAVGVGDRVAHPGGRRVARVAVEQLEGLVAQRAAQPAGLAPLHQAELDELLVDGVGGEDRGPLAPAVGGRERRLADARDEVVDQPDAGAALAGDQAPSVPAQHARALKGDGALEARVDEQAGRRQQVVVVAAPPAAAEQRRLPAHGERGGGGVEGEQRRHESGVETCQGADRFRAGARR
jgi:hypothetical protein